MNNLTFAPFSDIVCMLKNHSFTEWNISSESHVFVEAHGINHSKIEPKSSE